MSVDTRTYGASPQMPRQRIPLSRKNDSWREANVDAIDGIATSAAWDGRSSKERKTINYDLMNSKMNMNDVKYVVDPWGIGNEYGEQPARFRDMNILRQKIETLKGNEILRPFDFSVMSVNGAATSLRDKEKKRRLLETAQYIVRRDAGLTDEQEDSDNFQSLQDAADSMLTYSDIREQWGTEIIRNGLQDQRLEFRFSEGFEHGLIVGEEIYYVGIVAGEPVVRVVNPLYFEWEKGPESKNIQDAGWCREERYMSVSQILDEYATLLTESQVKMLDDGAFSPGMNRNVMLPGYAYTADSINAHDNYKSFDGRSTSNFLRVVTCTWKSMERIGFVIWTDEDGNEQQERVDEDYELSFEQLEMGARIEYEWINQVWQGTKIGDDMYLDINPIPNQMRTMDNESECKLPYVGMTYNNLNSQVTSLVDLMKPVQYLYNITWYKIEQEIAKSKGKTLAIDTAQIPKGMKTEQWLYNLDAQNIVYFNSMEEGKKGTRQQGKTSQNANPIKEFDRSMSNVVQQLMMILAKLEMQLDSISGVSDQMEGQIGQYETATGVQAAVQNSSVVTQYYMNRHDEIKRAVLQQYIETAKYAYMGGKKINYITSDLTRIAMTVDGDMFSDSDYNVFPTNANKDKLIKQKIEQLLPQAMQQDKANLSDAIKLIRTESISAYERQLVKGEQEKAARDQELQQQQSEIAQAQIDANKEAEAIKHQRELELIDRKGEWDIRKSTVQAAGFDEDKDRNANGIPDVIEIGAEQLEMQKLGVTSLEKQNDRAFMASEAEKERALKREEMRSKEKMNEDNNRTALKNKVVGESKSKK